MVNIYKSSDFYLEAARGHHETASLENSGCIMRETAATPENNQQEVTENKQEPKRKQRPAERWTNPIIAIKAKCLDCSYGSIGEVKRCTCTACPLYAFRLGKNPYRKKRQLTEAQRAEAVARLRKTPMVQEKKTMTP